MQALAADRRSGEGPMDSLLVRRFTFDGACLLTQYRFTLLACRRPPRTLEMQIATEQNAVQFWYDGETNSVCLASSPRTTMHT